ncbi:MAG: S-layer homology domain-containing protein [Bacillota bacterium]|nr:S-layer homology domain-containing protein [Bacillota bacterium]
MQNNYKENITRSDFCRLAIALLEASSGKSIGDLLNEKSIAINKAAFTDTRNEDILYANALGIVNGIGNGLFKPNGGITRSEAAAMLMRTSGLLSGNSNSLPHLYEDSQQIPSWAREAVYAAYDCGLMRGNNVNEFEPLIELNRETAIVAALRIYRIESKELTAEPFLYLMGKESEDGTVSWGYVDKTSKFIIDPVYSYASDWNGKYGIVSSSGSSGYDLIDINGNVVFSFHSQYSKPFFVGNMICSNDLDKANRELRSIPDGKILWSLYSIISPMFNGASRVLYSGSRDIYFSDWNGKVLFKSGGTSGLFYNKKCIALDGGGAGLSVRDKSGKNVSGVFYFKHYKDNVEMAAAFGDKVVVSNAEETKYGVMQIPDTVVVPTDCHEIELLPSGQILCKKNKDGAWSLLNEKGKEIYSLPSYFEFESRIKKPNFPHDYAFDKGLIFDGIGHYVFRSAPDELTVIDTGGKEVGHVKGLDCSSAFNFVNGLIKIETVNGVKYYSVNGAAVIG